MCKYQRRIWYSIWEGNLKRSWIQRVLRYCKRLGRQFYQLWGAIRKEKKNDSFRFLRIQEFEVKISTSIQDYARLSFQILCARVSWDREAI